MDASVPQPLIRSDGLRALLVLALGLTAILAVPVAWVLSIFDAPDWVVPATIAVLIAVPFAGSAIAVGWWSRTRGLRWLQVLAVVVLLGAGGLLVAHGAVSALGELSWRAPQITSSERLAEGLLWMAGGLVAIALLLAAIPLRVSGLAGAMLVLVCIGPATALAGGAIVVHETTVGCGGYDFDRARWQAEQPGGGTDRTLGMAAALVRCDTLDGASRAEVRQLLGPPEIPDRAARSWSWQVGWVNGLLGDGELLTVTFDARDRVRDAELHYGGGFD